MQLSVGESMKITRTIVTNIYTAHFDDGTVESINGRYSYAGAKAILQKIHPDVPISTVEISQEAVKYGMELEDFIRNATVIG